MPKIKNVSIERYYFNEINIHLHSGKTLSTDNILGKNFGIILNNFSGNKNISENNIDLLNRHNFKIINITGSYGQTMNITLIAKKLIKICKYIVINLNVMVLF